MPRRVNEGAARSRHRDPQRVVNAALNFLRSRQPREDRQAGSVRRRPAAWPHLVAAEVPDRARARAPRTTTVLWVGEVELVQPAAGAVDEDHVTVPLAGAATFHRGVWRDRVGPAVGLVGVLEADRDALGRGGDSSIRNPDRRAVVVAGAEVRVRARTAPDRGDDGIGTRVQRKAVDATIPVAALREHRAVAGAREVRRCPCLDGDQSHRGQKTQ